MIVAVFVQYQASVWFHTLILDWINTLHLFDDQKKTFYRYKSHFLFVWLIQWCSNHWQANPTTMCDIYSLSAVIIWSFRVRLVCLFFQRQSVEHAYRNKFHVDYRSVEDMLWTMIRSTLLDSVPLLQDHLWTCSLQWIINHRQIDTTDSFERYRSKSSISYFINDNPSLILDIWISMTLTKIQLFCSVLLDCSSMKWNEWNDLL